MVNPYAGEVAVTIDGTRHVLKLTFGALAELEGALSEDSLLDLVERFESGSFRARDVMALLLAGLRGGGWTGRAEDLLAAEVDGGLVGAAEAAALLLVRAFRVPEATRQG